MTTFRIEKDSMGEVQVPAQAYYGAQTQRAVENFPISGLRAHPDLITGTILVKKAAAEANDGSVVGYSATALVWYIATSEAVTIPLPPNKQLPNIKVLDVSSLLADAIRRIHYNESVSKLFE